MSSFRLYIQAQTVVALKAGVTTARSPIGDTDIVRRAKSRAHNGIVCSLSGSTPKCDTLANFGASVEVRGKRF